MKTKTLFTVLFIVLVAFIGCEKDDDPINEPTPPKSIVETKEFTSQALSNNPIGNSELRAMVVYTPPGYDATAAEGYPVVYLLHGLPFTEDSFVLEETWDEWIDPNGMFKTYPDFPQNGFQDWIDDLIETGKIEPMIIVMPNARSAYEFSFYTNSDLNGNFEDYIVTDVINYVDSNYNTISNKDGRSVIGFSQGGYAAFKLGMKHADTFSVVACHSGILVFEAIFALTPLVIAENPGGMMGPDPGKFLTSALYAMSAAWSPNLNNPPWMVDLPFEYPSGDVIPGIAGRWLNHDPFTLLDTYGDDFKSLKGIYFDCGNMDELGSCNANDFLTQKLDGLGVSYTYELFEGGHFDKMYSRLKISLMFCSEKMN